MGSQNSIVPNSEQIENSQKAYTLCYGNINIVRQSSGIIAFKRIMFENCKQISNYTTYSEEITKFARNVPSLQVLLQYRKEHSTFECSYPSLTLFFDYVPNSLRQIINDRASQLQNQKHSLVIHSRLRESRKIIEDTQCLTPEARRQYKNIYMELEIVQMFDHIAASLKILTDIRFCGRPYGNNINPSNITVGDDGIYRLVNMFLMSTSDNYNQECPIQGVYLSPEEWHSHKTADTQLNHDTQRCMIFSLGLVALEMCLLSCIMPSKNTVNVIQTIYNSKTYEINQQLLTKYQKLIGQRYPSRLTDIIRDMLQVNPANRLDLNSFIKKIINLFQQVSQRSSLRSSRLEDNFMEMTAQKKAPSMSRIAYNMTDRNELMESRTTVNKRVKEIVKRSRESQCTTEMEVEDLYKIYMLEYGKLKKTKNLKTVL